MAKKTAPMTPAQIRAAIEQCIDSVHASTNGSPIPIADWYATTYEDIRKHFADITACKGWNSSSVRLGFLIVYGWMPTSIRSFDHDKAAELETYLNTEVNDDNMAKVAANHDEMVKLAAQIANNSLVGGSKFLHFYDPIRFPITDSVLQLLTGKPSQYLNNNVELYQSYRAAVEQVSKHHRELAEEWANAAFQYRVTATRAIEALCFYAMKGEKATVKTK
ncbi:hypothetical protein AB4Y36_39060 [Paraburkholderia sp. BR10936]|uniref:hypothetical protein n=1 Tax=Paraburkholderia sp. BR10936 TaxID=3236993 RepID=UPI0034D23293